MELLALGAPWILLLLVVAALGLLIFGSWTVATGLLLLAVVGYWYFQVIPVNIVSGFCGFQKDSSDELKVMSFNCNLNRKKPNYDRNMAGIVQLIRHEAPDVVFLAEYNFEGVDSLRILLSDEYPYYAQAKWTQGNRLYSKYPVVSDTIYKEKGAGYGITYCQIDVKGRMLDVYGVHLSSNNYNEQMEYMTPDSVENGEQAKVYVGNILTASKSREKEARIVADGLQGSESPTIVMGDFNDVCGSPTLNVLESAGLKDAWWEGGTGYGATIHHPLPYRIDHIMHSDGLELTDVKVIPTDLSDHNPVVASFKIIRS